MKLYFYYEPGSIYNELMCICHQLPAARGLGGPWVPPPSCVTSHSRLNKHLFGWSEHLLSSDLVLLRCDQRQMNVLLSGFHKHDYSIMRSLLLIVNEMRGAFIIRFYPGFFCRTSSTEKKTQSAYARFARFLLIHSRGLFHSIREHLKSD